MKTYLTDTETCGLHGVPVILQYDCGTGVNVHHLWTTPIGDTMGLIEDIVDNRVVAHNLRFDWFHISKYYNMLHWLRKEGYGHLTLPVDLPVDLMAEAEWQSQYGLCLKPHGAIDTLLLAAKSEDQSFLMSGAAIYVRRVPVGLSEHLRVMLDAQTELPWILFAGKNDQEQRWQIMEHKDRQTGEIDPLWRDLKLGFSPSKSLKDLSKFLCNHEPSARFEEIAFEVYPAEEGYAPFAKLLSNSNKEWLYPKRKKQPNGQYKESLLPTWPAIIRQHIDHWANDEDALAYAVDDIAMLDKLYKFFGSPTEDMDGRLACQVASVRLRGFAVDLDKTQDLMNESLEIVAGARLNVGSPKQVLGFVAEALDETEQMWLINGCDQKVIDEIKNEFTLEEEEECEQCEETGVVQREDGETGTVNDCTCQRCEGRGSVGPTGKCETCKGVGDCGEYDKKGNLKKCRTCDGTGLSEDRKMPVVHRVEHIELIRQHDKRIQLFDKMLLAKRAYPDFNVIGTKSGRMSGASGMNFHGVDSSYDVRAMFVLADETCIDGDLAGEPLVLSAGDYSSQELAIAATTMNDEELMKDMESGKSLHGLFGAQAYETTYEDIIANKDDGRYGRAKGGVYAILYGGTFETVARNMGIEVCKAEAAYNRMVAKYPQMGNTRAAITERFSAIKQDGDGKIHYHDPPEKFIESVFGFRRYFDTEYAIQKMILDTISNLPQAWRDSEVKVERKEGKSQSLSGAVCSALYGAAFSIQNKVIRASNNHVIQSTGRHLTVGMQDAVWTIQPCGIHPFRLTLMSIHDELAVVSPRSVVPEITQTITVKVEEQCETVPLISIEWFTGNNSWAEKGSGSEGIVIGWSPEEAAA